MTASLGVVKACLCSNIQYGMLEVVSTLLYLRELFSKNDLLWYKKRDVTEAGPQLTF